MKRSVGRHLIRLVAGLVLLGAVAAVVCFILMRGPAVNVVLISIDTCRADYLGCYGYSGGTTPNIDKVAGEGVLFENVISPVPLTLPAHCSMLTGTIPPYHGVHDNHNYWLNGSNVTLAEVLRERGFSTAAFVSAFVMDSQFGLEQGFESYYDSFKRRGEVMRANERRGGETSALAVEWLERHREERFFLFLHYYDPHSGYEPPEPFASRFSDNPYAGEIAYTDHCIGVVIEKLKSLGLYDSSVIIITGDHGEMLGEHGEDEHGYFIYQGALKVPLIFKPAGKRGGRRVKEVVGLVDIFPTVLGLVGISAAGQVQGRDLSGYVRGDGEQEQGRYIYAESLYATKYNGNSLLGVVGRRWKYIQTTRPELYDLEVDGGESENLMESRAELAAVLQGELKRILKEDSRGAKSGVKAAMDEETIKRLESLGYVARAVQEDFEFSRDKTDPKDLLEVYVSSMKVSRLMEEGRLAEAKALCEEQISQGADHYEIYRALGLIAAREGDKEKAMGYMLRSLEGNANQADLHNYIGMTLAGEGRVGEGIEHFVKSLALNPHQTGVRFAWANVLEVQGELDEAAAHYLKILEIDPAMASAHNNLGSILLRQGDYERAEAHCSRALELEPGLAEGYYNMGNVRFQQGRFKDAVMYYEKALSLRPNWPEAQKNLGIAKGRLQSP